MNDLLKSANPSKRRLLAKALIAPALTMGMAAQLMAEGALDDFMVMKIEQVSKILRRSLPKGVDVREQARAVVSEMVLSAVA